jgi:hypothetical protein
VIVTNLLKAKKVETVEEVEKVEKVEGCLPGMKDGGKFARGTKCK